MKNYDKAFRKLKKAAAKVTSTRGDIPPRKLEKIVYPALDTLSAAYESTTPDQRVDTYLFFETRDNLLDALVQFAGERAQESIDLFEMGKREAALARLKGAVAAERIAAGRCESSVGEVARLHLSNAIAALEFDRSAYIKRLDLPKNAFIQRAVQYQVDSNKLEAIKALGIALQVNPQLATHRKANVMAAALTGKPAEEAVPLLSDRFERNLFIAEQLRDEDKHVRARSKPGGSALMFWLTTIGGGLILAVLPPVAFPLLFGLEADPKGLPPGMFVGIVTSVMFVVNQLRVRNSGRSGGYRKPRRRFNG
jgi:tetratricopeptide (TPR) repeat protein